MEDLEFVRAYIDDLLIITNGTYEDHMVKLDSVLTRLRDAGLKVNLKNHFLLKKSLSTSAIGLPVKVSNR